MAKQTRRKFLKQSSIGVAAAGVAGGVLVAAPHLKAMAAPSDAATVLSTASLSGPMMLYVRNLSKGEVGILVDTREIVYRDPDLVARLVKAAQ